MGMEPRGTKVDLRSLSDEMLVVHSRQGNKDAARILYERYWPFAAKEAQRRAGGDFNVVARDALKHGMLRSVLRAGFDPAIGDRLRPYLNEVIRNEIIELAKRNHRRACRHTELTETEVANARAGDAECLPVDEIVEQMLLVDGYCSQAVSQRIAEWRSPNRSQRGDPMLWATVLEMTADGVRPAEIATVVGRDVKTIYRALDRAVRPAVRRRMDDLARTDPDHR
jgi:DNA-directed RNA polymerase specialized sigma24 family protein